MADIHGKPLTARQSKALSALLICPSLAAAATACNIPQRTIYRYLRLAHFAEAYQHARHQQLGQAVAALQTAAGQAVAVLIEIATNADAKSTARVQAARALIEGALRASGFDALRAGLGE